MSDLNRPGDDGGIRGDPPHDQGADDEHQPEHASDESLPLRAVVLPPD